MPRLANAPENWPSTIPYLASPILSQTVPKDVLSNQALTSPSLEADAAVINSPIVPYVNVRITPIADSSHPAYGQAGLFTTRIHPPDSFICLYQGFVHGPSDEQSSASEGSKVDTHAPKSDYDLSLDRDLELAIDAEKMGNEARFVNDYRGIADRPNAEFRDVIIKLKGGKKERGVGIFVKSVKRGKKVKPRKENELGIAKGQEILVSYGRSFWSARTFEAEDAEAS